MTVDVTIYERDVWIVRYLQAASDGRTIREIWEAAQGPRVIEDETGIRPVGGLEESASLPTYHRTVGKLVARGQLIVREPGDGSSARYSVGPQVSSLTPFSQTELNEALWELGAAQALAMYADTLEQFEREAAKVLELAASRLREEDPRALVLRMLQDRARELDEDIADLRDPDTGEDEHRVRVARRLVEFGRFVHGELGLNPTIWRVPTLEEVGDVQEVREVASVERCVAPDDWAPVAHEIGRHVFGDAFIALEAIPPSEEAGRPPLIVAGSDGSSHVGFVRGMPASAYSDQDRLIMTFNNSAGYVELPEDYPTKSRLPSQYFGVPVTRAALEDPNNKGMIISRPYFPDLDDGEFEHMKKAALDVVQYRIDHALLSGAALPYGAHPMRGGEALPRPHLLIRDGTVSPQARELQNYTNPTEYGTIVREGVQLSYRILRLVLDSDRRVYAGAVKSTQLRTFSKIVNWYIQRGSALGSETAIDPTWNAGRMNAISDSVAMTRLLASLPGLPDVNQYYRTCVIVRPFSAMVTSLFRSRPGLNPEDWYAFFQEEAADASARYRARGGHRPFFDGLDVTEDDYVRLCVYADYGMFYFGKPGGSPQIAFPRFEFLDSIRTRREAGEADTRVARAVALTMAGVHRTKWSLDFEHNMMTNRKLPKIIPFVVNQSHEMCKVLGHKLANELQQVIAASLSAMKSLRGVAVPKIEIEPVPLERFQRYLDKLRRGARRQGEAISDEVSGRPVELDQSVEDAASELGPGSGNERSERKLLGPDFDRSGD